MSSQEKIKQEKQSIKEEINNRLRLLFEPYKGDTSKLKKIIPKQSILEAKWNINGLFPITSEDPVFLHENQSDLDKKYIRVVYFNGTYVCDINQVHFNIGCIKNF